MTAAYDTGNQFTNYQAAERVKAAYAIPHIKDKVEALMAALEQDPGSCLILHNKEHKIRRDGTRMRVATRAVLYYALGRPLPEFGFGHTLCRNKGCVNPEHQSERHSAILRQEAAPARPLPFTRVAPKVPVPSPLSASALGV